MISCRSWTNHSVVGCSQQARRRKRLFGMHHVAGSRKQILVTSLELWRRSFRAVHRWRRDPDRIARRPRSERAAAFMTSREITPLSWPKAWLMLSTWSSCRPLGNAKSSASRCCKPWGLLREEHLTALELSELYGHSDFLVILGFDRNDRAMRRSTSISAC